MRRRLALLAAVAGALAAFAVNAATSTALGSQPAAATFKCAQQIFSQTAGELKGFDFGRMLCTGPFGTGVQADNYAEKVKRGGTITSKGTFTDYFDAGSVRGTYTLTGRFTNSTSGRFTGPLKITKGTGAYASIKGTGTLYCATRNAGKTDNCLMKVTETGY